MERELTDQEKRWVGSVIGQVNWAARQRRFDFNYGASHCQQLAGQRDPGALAWANKVVRRAHQPLTMKMKNLGCTLAEVVILSISDSAYAAQPGGGSQGGLLIAIAHPGVRHGDAPVYIMEACSSRLQRVVRCSMAAELSDAATAYEHGDYLRVVFAEVMHPSFDMRSWKYWASRWKHVLVLDAKVAYDAVQGDNSPSDRKLIVDQWT